MKELRKQLPKAEQDRLTKQMERITTKRNRRTNHYLHTASKRTVDFLVKQGVGTIIIGKNPLWKQGTKRDKRNKQNFVAIPHTRLSGMLTYKASPGGIQVEVQEESYTSKASFLDLDPIPTYKPNDEACTRSAGSGLAKETACIGRKMDGSSVPMSAVRNILRQSRPDAFANGSAKGVAAYVVQPGWLAISV